MSINVSVNLIILKEIIHSAAIYHALIVMKMDVLLVEALPQFIIEKLLPMYRLDNVIVLKDIIIFRTKKSVNNAKFLVKPVIMKTPVFHVLMVWN